MPLGLHTSDYDFELPSELIAQAPLPQRDASRLMVIDRGRGTIEHRQFTDLAHLLQPHDLLVLNRSRVVRARLLGRRFGSGARAEVVLHVGAGTFKPVEVEDPAEHVMHEERYTIPETTAESHARTRAEGGRVWAVGTTTVRTLESAADDAGHVHAGSSETRIFIRPPAKLRAIDAVITNFHLPRSTLIMLVAAVAGYDLTMRAYREAIAERYRFYSYGDAMAIV